MKSFANTALDRFNQLTKRTAFRANGVMQSMNLVPTLKQQYNISYKQLVEQTNLNELKVGAIDRNKFS